MAPHAGRARQGAPAALVRRRARRPTPTCPTRTTAGRAASRRCSTSASAPAAGCSTTCAARTGPRRLDGAAGCAAGAGGGAWARASCGARPLTRRRHQRGVRGHGWPTGASVREDAMSARPMTCSSRRRAASPGWATRRRCASRPCWRRRAPNELTPFLALELIRSAPRGAQLRRTAGPRAGGAAPARRAGVRPGPRQLHRPAAAEEHARRHLARVLPGAAPRPAAAGAPSTRGWRRRACGATSSGCSRSWRALCGPAEPPARLHGDLWGGNLIARRPAASRA